MGHRQKGHGRKRKRSWHRRGPGPDRAFRKAIRRLERAGMN
uniref:DNA adenine methyltransferase n=1 Tax=Arthrobacter phage SWEP2 TaxID=2945958 RepID=A0A9E7MIN9_9CAUD